MQVANKSPMCMSSRGARFLDLVLQNKLNVSPQLTLKANRRFSLGATTTTPKNDKKEYLNFSSEVKFDPAASPSSGILMKRKTTDESSPANSSSKRKRVGFRDPVSSTKEYLITAEEEKHKSNSSNLIRCLVYDEFVNEEEDDNVIQKPLQVVVKEEQIVPVEMEVEVKAEGSPMIDENPQNTDISTTEVEPTSNLFGSVANDANQFTFKDKDEMMSYVKNNFSLDELLKLYVNDELMPTKRRQVMKEITEQIDLNNLMDEYFPETDDDGSLSDEQSKFVLSMLDHLSALMKKNLRVKHKMMDILSEKYSDDFLDHALQENSVSHVCEKISVPKIVSFLIHRANACSNDSVDDAMFTQMNRKILHHLIESTSSRELVGDRKEAQTLMTLIFRKKPKIEIFDTAHEFLRNLV